MLSKAVLKNIMFGLKLLIVSVILSFVLYLNSYFHLLYFEQLLYNVLNMESLNITSLQESIYSIFLGTFIFMCFLSLPIVIAYFFKNLKWNVCLFGKTVQLFPFSLKWYTRVLLSVSIFLFVRQIGFFQYAWNQFSNNSFYENYYVQYEEENVSFPEEKQNLIYIYVESFENSIFSLENGGLNTTSYAPNMEKLANEYINFSNTDTLGGFQNMKGTNWTAAAMVAQTAGIPIYIQTKNKSGNYLEGAISLGEILQENGYQNYLMMGSDAAFAERDKYFQEHGNYEIFDYIYAKNNVLISSDYFVWWGYEDKKLYEFAKNQLSYISKKDDPFNFTILTADTHYFNGYTDSSCPKVFQNNYANSFYCMDLQLSSFIQWIMEQDFYENTTIVIVGDHLAMRSDLFVSEKEYNRTVFNLFINSKVDTQNIKNREFTAFDLLPSTLASLGVTIKDNRIALGTNLFSDKETLLEEIGYEEFEKGLRKKSQYYQDNILNEKKE